MNCDGIARWYQYFEYLAFGRALKRRRLEYLDEVADARRVLILGDGDGRFTAQFVKRNLRAVVDFVDSSAGMVELAEKRVGGIGSVRFRVGDARTVELGGTYDLVVTHFFLDCFEERELDDLVGRVTGCCEPEARWLISDFGLPAGGAGRLAALALIRFMYFFFWIGTGLEVTRLPDYAAVLARNGFRVRKRRETAGGLLVSELWELFGAQGDHGIDLGGAPSRQPGS